MNKDQLEGRIEEAKGKAKETFGQKTGQPGTANEGTAEKAGGKAHKAYGDVKEDLKKDLGRS
ncbi:MAG: CsbD family protein [Acetobacteraceae bacterium]